MSRQRDSIIGGGPELNALLQTLPTKVEKNIMRAALRAGAAVFLPEVKRRIPVDQGPLRASARITSRVRKGSVQVSVKVGNSVAWYAHLVEFGTRPHYIKVSDEDRGRGRGRGRVGSANRVETLASIRSVNRRVLQIGANFVGPSVHHPGSREQPFARPAAEDGMRTALDAVTAKVRERLTAQGLNAPPALPMDPQE